MLDCLRLFNNGGSRFGRLWEGDTTSLTSCCSSGDTSASLTGGGYGSSRSGRRPRSSSRPGEWPPDEEVIDAQSTRHD